MGKAGQLAGGDDTKELVHLNGMCEYSVLFRRIIDLSIVSCIDVLRGGAAFGEEAAKIATLLSSDI